MEILSAKINMFCPGGDRDRKVTYKKVAPSPPPAVTGEGPSTPSPLPFLPGPIKQQLTDKVGLPKSILRSTPFHSLNILQTISIWKMPNMKFQGKKQFFKGKIQFSRKKPILQG